MTLSVIRWDPNPEIFRLPLVDFPILWYGIFFAFGFWLAYHAFIRILTRYLASSRGAQAPERAREIADRLTLYVVIGTVLGARLGHFLFYESPSDYLSDPLEFFRLHHGGLASHGAALGIIAAVFLFSRRIRKRFPGLDWMRLLDFLSAPAALAGASIRIGNFFNQEILGTPTNLPWAIVFGHPIDRSLPIPRHPAQLYEALGYLALFLLLWNLSRRTDFLSAKGKLVGLFLMLAFGFRFLIEFIKTEQSQLITGWSALTMGQWLSVPAILLGFFLYFHSRPKKNI